MRHICYAYVKGIKCVSDTFYEFDVEIKGPGHTWVINKCNKLSHGDIRVHDKYGMSKPKEKKIVAEHEPCQKTDKLDHEI